MSRRLASRQQQGRKVLGVIYAAYCLVFVADFFTVPDVDQSRVVGLAVITMVWITALFIAMARGRNWARIMCMVILLVLTLLDIAFMFDVVPFRSKVTVVFCLEVAVHIAVFLTLLRAPRIRSLVTKNPLG